MTVNVKLFSTTENVAENDIDGHIARTNAQLGFPVEVRLQRGNNTHVIHLTTEDAAALHTAIGRLPIW